MTSQLHTDTSSPAHRLPIHRFLVAGVGSAAFLGVGLFFGAGTAAATPEAGSEVLWGYLENGRGAQNALAEVDVDYRRACGLICNRADGTLLNPNGQAGGILFGNGGAGFSGAGVRNGGRAGMFGSGGIGGAGGAGAAGGAGGDGAFIVGNGGAGGRGGDGVAGLAGVNPRYSGERAEDGGTDYLSAEPGADGGVEADGKGIGGGNGGNAPGNPAISAVRLLLVEAAAMAALAHREGLAQGRKCDGQGGGTAGAGGKGGSGGTAGEGGEAGDRGVLGSKSNRGNDGSNGIAGVAGADGSPGERGRQRANSEA